MLSFRPGISIPYSFLVLLLAVLPSFVLAADERFDIQRYQVEGNTLLPAHEVEALLAPMTGRGRVYGDIQKALEALEAAYRGRGYSTVQVHVPEQELGSGAVRIRVTEAVLEKITVVDNLHFTNENVLAGLPSLRLRQVPDLAALSGNIQLSNENPAKQVEVLLGAGDQEGKVEAKVTVTEVRPQRIFFTADNTGTPATGKWRTGVAFQHANLFGRDHVMTMAYTSSPDSPSGVNVNMYSIGYRLPLYSIGDSVDFIYGNSSVNTPSSTPTLGGALAIVGKGDILGVRWNHYFPRRGQQTEKLVVGLDHKYSDARCSFNGIPLSIAPPTPPVSSCVPYTTNPLSATWVGQHTSPGQSLDFNFGIAVNIARGTRYTSLDGTVDRYSYLNPGSRTTQDHFRILRGGVNWLRALPADWQLKASGTFQFSRSPLVAAEQIGLAGSSTVRGFSERALAADSGYTANLEWYTPELAARAGIPGTLRVLAFQDLATGFNNNVGGTVVPRRGTVASIGAGLRYASGRNVAIRADFARIVETGPLAQERDGHWRGHVALMIGF
ncbi:ShlB/FhaC/HecB family hemolysin secretion/activation protein [Lacisediminimonas sp.]|uniref:ShlB/FhaC/HecB family hemolysin secretion/activation protein n=1 Tax=Lacisediminimonas sp. TaxID=3060582 RepID=UPI0027162B52|nr:ShlB/FhaC/HecB family hemolysin secretion/activation protein [Lacisediminimonas sp.]MDO8300848.1 ShlB/FhaC/HecB family hemolysin secretion/activation protein [Lacisediminimonas sp.]